MSIVGNVRKTRKSVQRNLLLLFLIWLLELSGYEALEIIQSSLNQRHGVWSVTVLHCGKALSSLFGPLVVKRLTPKWTLVTCWFILTLFIVASVFPNYYTLLPAGALMGLALGPIWVCQGVYVTCLAVYYSEVTGQSKSAVLSKFNGIAASTIPVGVLVGNAVSSLVFTFSPFNDEANNRNVNKGDVISVQDNSTAMTATVADASLESTCGNNFCPMENQENFEPLARPAFGTVVLFLSILAAFNICGIGITVFGLQNLPQKDITPHAQNIERTHQSGFSWVRKYVTTFFRWQHLALVPFIAYLWFVIAVTNSTYTRAYIACSVGIENVGFIFMICGLSGGAATYASGFIGQWLHRNYHFVLAFFLFVAVYTVMLGWTWLEDSGANTTVLLLLVMILICVGAAINGLHFAGMYSVFHHLHSLSIHSYIFGFHSLTRRTCTTCTRYRVLCEMLTAFLGDAFTDTKTEVFSFYNFCDGICTAIGFALTNYICVRYQVRQISNNF